MIIFEICCRCSICIFDSIVTLNSFNIYLYASGMALSSIIRSYAKCEQPIPSEVLQSIMEQSVAAVQYLSSISLIHNDLKPDNVLFNWYAFITIYY